MQRPDCFCTLFFNILAVTHQQFLTLMEQEVQVTIHSSQPDNLSEEEPQETRIPGQVKEISEALSEAFSCFRESESYNQLLKSAEKAREYIRKNPGQAMLYSLGAGALFGLFMKRKR